MTEKDYIAYACADCLEDAGGRQRHHHIAWHIDLCPVCARRTTVTRPEYFGNPPLEIKTLPLNEESHG